MIDQVRTRWLAWLGFCCLLLSSGLAHAFGSARAESTTLQEVEGRWKLKLVIDYGSLPDVNFVPMTFKFTQTMHYERALTDESGEKPVINKRPLSNQAPIFESVEVGFTDGATKTFKVTKFDVGIRRDRGFEAGEYDLEIRRSSDDKPVGTKIRLVLNGENPIVDRRSMVFHTDKPKDKKPEDTSKPPPSSDGAKDENVQADGELEPNPDDAPGPPPVEPKQGGCGCRLGSAPSSAGALGVLTLACALLIRRRHTRPSV